jgi:hypothetical protein
MEQSLILFGAEETNNGEKRLGELEENLREFQFQLKKQWRDLEGFGADESIVSGGC